MESTEANRRAEAAWKQLSAWARKWHHTGPIIGSLGMSSLAAVYFPDVGVEPITRFLANAKPRFWSGEKAGNGEKAMESVLRSVSEFLAACSDRDVNRCAYRGEGQASLRDRAFEYRLTIARAREVTKDVDVRIGWVPLEAFHNCDDLKERFLKIFSWFFSIQDVLQAKRTLLCLEYCPQFRTDPSAWIEI